MPNEKCPKSQFCSDGLKESVNPKDYPPDHPLSEESFHGFLMQVMQNSEGKAGQSIERRNPQLAAEILWKLSLGKSRLQVMRETGVTMETLRRLVEDNSHTVDEKRKQLASIYGAEAQRYIGLLQKKADLLEDDDEALKNTPPDKLAVVIGILTDHYNKLTGNNTITIEHKKGATIEDAQKWQDELRAKLAQKVRNSAIEAEVISEQPE